MDQKPQNSNDRSPQDKVVKTGKTMWLIAWGFGLLLLTQFFSGVLDRQNNPNQSPSTARFDDAVEVTLIRNRAGHYVANGEINGFPVVFMLDTGATAVAIPKSIAERIGLKQGAAYQTQTANGIGLAYDTKIEKLSIGGIQFYDLRAGITENMPGEQVLLGMNALKQIEFTQRGDRLTLRQYR